MPPNVPDIKLLTCSSQLRVALLDLRDFASFTGLTNKRDAERAGARFVIQRVLDDGSRSIRYENSGKPFLDEGPKISISHAFDKLAVAFFSGGMDPGIDIEKVRDKVIAIRHKYLSGHELKDLEGSSALAYTLYWAAKEAMYKASGLAGLIFARELLLDTFEIAPDSGSLVGHVLRPGHEKKYTLHYHILGEYVLAYTYACEER